MASSLEQRLREAEDYARTVQDNFNNNLQVIDEQEQQINALNQRLAEFERQNESFRESIERLQEERELEARIARNQQAVKQEEHEREVAEVAALIEAKYRREIETVSQRTGQQLRAARTQLLQRDESSRRMLQENSRLVEVINDLKEKQLDLEQQVTSLIDEKKAMSSKMALHEQQLEGIRVCNSNWEEALKQKIKDAHDERQKLEEQFADYKLTAKEKLRRQKEDLARSITKITEESQKKFREAVFEHKQLQFNFDKVQGELREKTKELQLLRDQKKKMESTLNRYDEHERAFNWNQKQRNQLQQMLEQQKKDAKLQLDSLNSDLKNTQELFQGANKKREDAEKAVERLKVELLNRAKESDQLKKTVTRLQHKARENQQAPVQAQIQPQAANSYKPFDRAYDSKGFDIIQSGQIEEDYSKVFTDDVGVVDSKFFEPAKSPKHNNSSPKAQRMINREAQLMKQISQLQLELQDSRSVSKRYLQQTESLRRMVEERSRELSLIKDKVNLYWEKANDKEQQVNGLKEMNSELKTSYNQITQQLKRYREFETQWRAKQQELHSLKEKVLNLEKEMKEMEEQIDIITKDRDLMEQISSDLRADNHTLREILAGNYEPQQDHSFTKSHHEFTKSQQDIRHPEPKEQETVPIYQPERQRFPKKLHDLVREKKMLSISGKRAAMEERATEARLQQIRAGTDSQKEVLQRIKQRNKTPPKIANYAQMKKQKERRSQQLQTVSQKQAYQRLKSRQNPQNLQQSPERGVNYLRLRQMGAQ